MGISFFTNYFTDFWKERILQIVKQSHSEVICLKLSSSSVVELGLELGQLDPFLYATPSSRGLDMI